MGFSGAESAGDDFDILSTRYFGIISRAEGCGCKTSAEGGQRYFFQKGNCGKPQKDARMSNALGSKPFSVTKKSLYQYLCTLLMNY